MRILTADLMQMQFAVRAIATRHNLQHYRSQFTALLNCQLKSHAKLVGFRVANVYCGSAQLGDLVTPVNGYPSRDTKVAKLGMWSS